MDIDPVRRNFGASVIYGKMQLSADGKTITVQYESLEYSIALNPELKNMPDDVKSAIVAMLKSGKASEIHVTTKTIDNDNYQINYKGFKKTALALKLLLCYNIGRVIGGR